MPNRRRVARQWFVGSGVVTAAFYGSETTTLQLQTFAGSIDYVVEDTPDVAAAAAFSADDIRPVSVKVQACSENCSVLALTSDGPRHTKVTLGAALALQQQGVRMVVDGGLHLDVSCSTYARTVSSFADSRP